MHPLNNFFLKIFQSDYFLSICNEKDGYKPVFLPFLVDTFHGEAAYKHECKDTKSASKLSLIMDGDRCRLAG